MSNTAFVSEMGLSIPGYLQIDFARDLRQKRLLVQGGFGAVFLADAFSSRLKEYGDLVVFKSRLKSLRYLTEMFKCFISKFH